MALITQDRTVLTAQEIVDILLGTGVTVSNISITGDLRAIGSFVDETRDSIGISEGVILSSGNIADATGPNTEDGKTSSFGTPGDADLNALLPSGQTTNDAVVLEFDFIPNNEQFLFEYVFASEEYNEFAGSSFNDIFAFFLNGENIALIPGTNTPVSINNINATNNSAFFLNNDFGDLTAPYPYNTQFDGFTTTFAASALVTPNQKQRLKITIADTSDSILDSAVFLKQGSLSTLGQIDDAIIVNNGRDIFTVESLSDTAGFANLELTLKSTNSGQINEIGIFKVDDDQGTINGIKPGQDGYDQLALTGSQSRVIFTGLPEQMGTNTTRNLKNFNVGDKFAFYMITNGTTDEVLYDELLTQPTVNTNNLFTPEGDRVESISKPANPFSPGLNVFFSFANQNTDGQDHLNVSQNNDTFQLSWEEELNGSNPDFNDLIFDLKVTNGEAPQGIRQQGSIQRELIDLSAFSDNPNLNATFEVKSEAAFNNTVGLYQIENAQGTVVDPLTGGTLIPSDTGYAEAALRNRVVSFDRNGNVIEGTNNINDIISNNGLVAPFIISNGTFSEWLNDNSNNTIFGEKAIAYFPFIDANPDKGDHVVLLGNNTFGFEDLPGGNSDFDYDDMTLQVNLF